MDVTFADEFDGNDVGPEWGRSWFRIGQTLWSSDQSTVADGILTITAKRTAAGWVSSELDTLESFTQRYGHFSARIKAPAGRGLWPTFWLAEGWRKSHAEIDIMEICANPPGTHDGNDQTVLHHFVHAPTGEHLHETAIPVANLTGVWHVFELDWRRERMSFVVDGVEVYAVTDAATIPNRDMAIVIDLAVGGWCGEPDETTPNPSELQIDWIRATE